MKAFSKGQTEAKHLLAIISFIAFLSFMSLLPNIPEQLKIISPIDIAVLTGEFVTVSVACVVATGIPCGVALGIVGFTTFFKYFITAVSWFQTLIIIPLTVVLLYILLRLARGGG